MLDELLASGVKRDLRRLTLNFRNNQYEAYAEYTINDVHRGFVAKGTDAHEVLREVLGPSRLKTLALTLALHDLETEIRNLL